MRFRRQPLSRWVWGTRLGLCAALAGVVATVLTLQPVGPTYAVGTLDQQQTTQDAVLVIISAQGFTQTFTAGATGTLDQVDLPLVNLGAPATFAIEIRNVVGGAPGSTVLASTSQSTSSLPPLGILPFAFTSLPISPGVPVTAGTQYAIAVRPVPVPGVIELGFSTTDVYPSGDLYLESPPGSFTLLSGADAAFRTFVTPLPTDTPTPTLTATPTLTTTPTLTPTATVTPTATSTGTVTPTSTAAATSTPTATPTGTVTSTATATVPATATATATATLVPSANDPNNDDEKPKETREERQQRQHTNAGNRDDVHTEGYVTAVETAPDGQSLLATIALGPGGQERLTVQVPCPGGTCPDVRVGDELAADGYQNGVGDPNTYFVASDGITVWRNGHKLN